MSQMGRIHKKSLADALQRVKACSRMPMNQTYLLHEEDLRHCDDNGPVRVVDNEPVEPRAVREA